MLNRGPDYPVWFLAIGFKLKRIKFFSILLMSLVMNVPAWAQWNLKGRVVDENGKPLALANVLLKETNNLQVTGDSGYFHFDDLERHTSYHLKVSFVGYQPRELEANLNSGFLKVSLKPLAVTADELVVSAVRAGKETPVAHSDLTKMQIQKANAGKDLPYLLNQMPSVISYSDAGAGVGYTGLRIRGSDITRINVTVDGVPLNDPESQAVFWVDVPDISSSLSSLQLQRGVGTSTNGAGAFGASLNLQTDGVQETPGAHIEASGGSFNTQRYSVEATTGLMKNHFWFDTRLSDIRSDGYVDRASSNLQSFYFSGGYVGKRTSVKALVFGGKEKTYQSWYGVDSATYADNPTFNYAGAFYDANGNISGFYPNETDNYWQDNYQVHINHQAGEHWKLNLALHYTYGKGYYEEYRQAQPLDYYGLPAVVLGNDTVNSSDLVCQLWLQNNFYGAIANAQYDNGPWKIIFGGAANEYIGDHYGNLVWSQFASTANPDFQFYFNRSHKRDWNGFAKFYRALGEKFTAFLDLQLRGVNYDGNGMDEGGLPVNFSISPLFFNPKAGLTWNITSSQSAYLSYSVGHREPNRDDILAADPNNLPQPEKLQDWEAGYHFQHKKLHLSGNLFYMFYTNQLVLSGAINNVGAFVRTNVGKSYRAGIELSGEVPIQKNLIWQPNVSLSQNQNLDYKVQNGNDVNSLGNTEISFSPPVVAGSVLNWSFLKHFSLGWQAKYVAKQYLTNTENDRTTLDAYFLNNFTADYRISSGKTLKSLRLFFNVYNAFNEKYAPNGFAYDGAPYYYPQAGINFLGGITADF